MEALKKPKLDDIKHCCGCGMTTHHVRKNEDEPWTCVFCGAEKHEKPVERRDDGS